MKFHLTSIKFFEDEESSSDKVSNLLLAEQQHRNHPDHLAKKMKSSGDNVREMPEYKDVLQKSQNEQDEKSDSPLQCTDLKSNLISDFGLYWISVTLYTFNHMNNVHVHVH